MLDTTAMPLQASLIMLYVLQEFFFYCPPGLRSERGKLGRRAGAGKRALPEAECLTPASKRARLTYLATTKDVNKALPLPEDLVCVFRIFPGLRLECGNVIAVCHPLHMWRGAGTMPSPCKVWLVC